MSSAGLETTTAAGARSGTGYSRTLVEDFLTRGGYTAYPTTYWEGLTGARANRQGSVADALKAYDTAWLESEAGALWMSQNKLTPDTAAALMLEARTRDRRDGGDGRDGLRPPPKYGDEPGRLGGPRGATGGTTSSTPSTTATAPPGLGSAAKIGGEAAMRQRRRAAVGSAGRVRTGLVTALQEQIGATGAPRTLIGS